MERGMVTQKPRDESKRFGKNIKAASKGEYVLSLYVTGMTPRSLRAIANIRKICENYLKGRYDLEVIDIYRQSILTEADQILAAPTFIKKLPPPLRRLIGDMISPEKILLSLDLRPNKASNLLKSV